MPGWDLSEMAGLIFAQDAKNQSDFMEIIERPIRERGRKLAMEREIYSRVLMKRSLPSFLHGLLDHPRALKLLLRIVPRWRPYDGLCLARNNDNRRGRGLGFSALARPGGSSRARHLQRVHLHLH